MEVGGPAPPPPPQRLGHWSWGPQPSSSTSSSSRDSTSPRPGLGGTCGTKGGTGEALQPGALRLQSLPCLWTRGEPARPRAGVLKNAAGKVGTREHLHTGPVWDKNQEDGHRRGGETAEDTTDRGGEAASRLGTGGRMSRREGPSRCRRREEGGAVRRRGTCWAEEGGAGTSARGRPSWRTEEHEHRRARRQTHARFQAWSP